MERYNDSSFMMEIRYEDLINDSVEVVKNILAFLEVNKDFDLSDILFSESENILVNRFNEHLHINIEHPPKAELINKWSGELTKEEIQNFEKEAGDTLVKKGYTLFYN